MWLFIAFLIAFCLLMAAETYLGSKNDSDDVRESNYITCKKAHFLKYYCVECRECKLCVLAQYNNGKCPINKLGKFTDDQISEMYDISVDDLDNREG